MSNLSEKGITALKNVAKNEGVRGYSKYNSKNKIELVELILSRRKLSHMKRVSPPVASDRSYVLDKKCMNYLKNELVKIAGDLNLSSSGTKKALCERILKIYTEPSPGKKRKTKPVPYPAPIKELIKEEPSTPKEIYFMVNEMEKKIRTIEAEINSSALSPNLLRQKEGQIRIYINRLKYIRRNFPGTYCEDAKEDKEDTADVKEGGTADEEDGRKMNEYEATIAAEREAVTREKEILREKMKKERLIKPSRHDTLSITSIDDIENQLAEITIPPVSKPLSLGIVRNAINRELGLTF